MHLPAWIFKLLFFGGLLAFQIIASRRRRDRVPATRSPGTSVPVSADSVGGGVAISSKPLTPK